MLPRSHRISSNQFPAVTRGKVFQNDLFRIVIKYDEVLKNAKCAVIVSNKIAKTAVARNRIRRQVYAVLAELIHQLPIAYVSIFPKKVLVEHQQIIDALRSLLVNQK